MRMRMIIICIYEEQGTDLMGDHQNIERPSGPPEQAHLPTITSRELLRGSQKLLIDHEGEVYHLSVTRQGKLILTK